MVITPHGNVKVKRKAHPEWTDFLVEQEISRNPSTNPFMTAFETFKEDLGIETTAKVIMENTDLKDHDSQELIRNERGYSKVEDRETHQGGMTALCTRRWRGWWWWGSHRSEEIEVVLRRPGLI